MTSRRDWLNGARPQTLPAAIAPVLVGYAIAVYEQGARPLLGLLALIVALAFQVGANYANDYSDGIRGTDTERVGPVRLVGQGLADATAVKRAAFYAFAVGAVAGLLMVVVSGYLLLIPFGLAAVAAAWFYTGGSKPYGYQGFGEVFVFIFFGLVAVVGTSASQTGHITMLSVLAGIGCGALSCAILVTNNLRDVSTDTQSGKRTLAVMLGDRNTREFYRTLILVAYAMPVIMTLIDGGPAYAYICLLTLIPARRPLMEVNSGASGKDLIPVLITTARMLLMYSMSLAIGIAASPTS